MNVTKLTVPYFSQLDNKNDPYGTCNVTAIAMCLAYFGENSNTPREQLEDELYHYMKQEGLNRRSPTDLAYVVGQYGLRDDFRQDGTIKQAQIHLQSGNPCVIHGWFTQSGHIVTLVGCDDKGFLVHDPYGEWFENGYDRSASGAYLHYSYRMIERLCMPDGKLWLHRISA